MSGLLFVISAPSGCGKTTVIEELLKKDKRLIRCLTFTTREKRIGEQDGVDYHFITREDFKGKIALNFFVEYALVYENYYGTSRSEVEVLLQSGKDVILSVDVQGARTIRSKMDPVMIFLAPPSLDTLKERLLGRGTENETDSKRRLEEAKRELAEAQAYDYTVVNDSLDDCVRNILNLIEIERKKE